jgi:predicted MPP superfamily phosphohydrolase
MLSLLALLAGPVSAQEIVVDPYLQLATPTSVWILWETSSGDESVVEWGPTAGLGSTATGSAQTGLGDSRVHEVQLTGLSPGSELYYRVRTGGAVSDTVRIITPAEASAEQSFRLVAMSDMQQDWSQPTKYAEIVQDGILPFVTEEYGPDIPAELGLVLIPGDLVDNGWDYDSWAETFFAPGAALMAQVPTYPVLGNHEINTSYYFQYFHLPVDDVDPAFEEHWYTVDHGNLRVVGLDSNPLFQSEAQLDWLEAVLDDAAVNPDIDFVFAQLHHPYLSELWLDGETAYTGEVIGLMEAFTEATGKPSIHFFGHTHGYSRGQSRDHRHLWVNVATAGGNIDEWGEYAQANYDEFTVSQDEYGFVIVEVTAGADPSFKLTRVGRGDASVIEDNVVRDEVTVYRYAEPPDAPEPSWPSGEGVGPDCVTLTAGGYSDPDGEAMGAAQWQLAESCDGFDAPVVDRWVQHQDWYGGVDLQAGDDLTDEVVETLAPERSYCWRVRYRDQGLSWSDWSEPLGFETGVSVLSDELLENPGAEDGTTGWDLIEGVVESLTDGECNGVEPHSGDRYLAVGGLCDETAYGEVAQRVDVEAFAEAIDAGEAVARYGGWLRDWAGDDVPSIELAFVDAGGAELGRTGQTEVPSPDWTEVAIEVGLPAGTRAVDVVLTGTRTSGSDNDSYFDDLTLRVRLAEVECDTVQDVEPDDTGDTGGPVDTEDTDDDTVVTEGSDDTEDPDVAGDDPAAEAQDTAGAKGGCGCDSGAGGGSAVLLLAAALASRRRRSA